VKSIGKIVYGPNSHLGSPKNWAILMCDEEIGRYYRHLYEMEYPYLNGKGSSKLIRSVWGVHCSFVRSEVVSSSLWKMNENKLVEFDYYPPVKTNGEYYWLNVKCSYLLNLRERYGLPREPRFGLHLSIGRTMESKRKKYD
jgi:hypothetical protein